jgi:hypothetical protein
MIIRVCTDCGSRFEEYIFTKCGVKKKAIAARKVIDIEKIKKIELNLRDTSASFFSATYFEIIGSIVTAPTKASMIA